MRIWIDLGNSPHVPFFKALAGEFESRRHEIIWTARDYAQTVELARNAGIDAEVFGTHGGKNVLAKGAKFGKRVLDLIFWARGRKVDLVVSHNSQEPLVAARVLGIRSVTLMDYEHHPGNHLSFRAAKRVIVPASFPDEALRKFGVTKRKLRRFNGIKEDVYLADFKADPGFSDELAPLGIGADDILVVVRPHAPEALYHRQHENVLLDRLLDHLAGFEKTKIVLLPRKSYQGDQLRSKHPQRNIVIPDHALDGANLIAAADMVFSGGGTMNREAAALGVPAYTVFAGEPAAIDAYLIDEGRLRTVETEGDVLNLTPAKKEERDMRRNMVTRSIVADLILED
jgi:predicted glycosyltransferase